MTETEAEEREKLRHELPDASRYGKKLDKAIDTVVGGGVKENRFLPSGRAIFTVVGNLGDEFIDPDKPYCSCSHFFFRVRTGKDDTCYHLLSHGIAARRGMIVVTEFSDEEYEAVLSAIVGDVFAVLNRS